MTVYDLITTKTITVMSDIRKICT